MAAYERRRRGRTALSALLPLALLLLTACWARPSPSPAPTATPTPEPPQAVAPAEEAVEPAFGGSVTIALAADAVTLNPILWNDAASASVGNRIFEGLITADPATGAPVPLLAESWSVSPDGLTYTFHLRQGVVWHDGAPFTAEDVKFTYEALADPKTVTPRKALLEPIVGAQERMDGRARELAGVRVLDPYTVEISLKENFCPFLFNLMPVGILPKHLLERSPDLNADEFNTRRPVGTGPFRFQEWQRDDHLTLVANERYWGGRPFLDTLRFQVVRDAAMVVDRLRRGDLDVGVVQPRDLRQLGAVPTLTLYSFVEPSYTFIAYNLERPFFKDRRVRQALTMGLDRRLMLDRLLEGQGVLVNSHGTPASWAYEQDLPSYPYDPARARRLLQDAGYSYGADGRLRDREGRPVRLRVYTNSGNRVREGVLTLVREQWRELGIEVEPELESFTALTERFTLGRDFDALIAGWTLGWDPDARPLFHSDEARIGGLNGASFRHGEVDRLLTEGRRLPSCDMAERKAIYSRVQRVLAEEQPYAFLFAPKALVAATTRLRGIAASPHFGPGLAGVLWSSRDWFVVEGR